MCRGGSRKLLLLGSAPLTHDGCHRCHALPTHSFNVGNVHFLALSSEIYFFYFPLEYTIQMVCLTLLAAAFQTVVWLGC